MTGWLVTLAAVVLPCSLLVAYAAGSMLVTAALEWHRPCRVCGLRGDSHDWHVHTAR